MWNIFREKPKYKYKSSVEKPMYKYKYKFPGEKPKYKYNNTGPVLGVVGGSYSSVSLQVVL